MDGFSIVGESGRTFRIQIGEVNAVTADVVETLLEIDHQTFSEATFSRYTAAAFLAHGRTFMLYADDLVIGSCVTTRCWSAPNEFMMLSMGIRPGWRGRGLGTRFTSGVIERLRNIGATALVLMVGAENRRAINIYEDLGFRVVDEVQVGRWSGDLVKMMRLMISQSQVAQHEQ